MKSISELNPMKHDTSLLVRKNLEMTFERIMEIQDAWLDEDPTNMPFKITSGLRSDEGQQVLIAQGKTNAKHSKHLCGLAVDIADPDGKIVEWLIQNPQIMARVGVWMEHPKYTPTWVHLQATPPKSGNRVFTP